MEELDKLKGLDNLRHFIKNTKYIDDIHKKKLLQYCESIDAEYFTNVMKLENFTRPKDANGELIYDGDIMRSNNPHESVVFEVKRFIFDSGRVYITSNDDNKKYLASKCSHYTYTPLESIVREIIDWAEDYDDYDCPSEDRNKKIQEFAQKIEKEEAEKRKYTWLLT